MLQKGTEKKAVLSQAGLLLSYPDIFLASISTHRFITGYSQIRFLYSETMVKSIKDAKIKTIGFQTLQIRDRAMSPVPGALFHWNTD